VEAVLDLVIQKFAGFVVKGLREGDPIRIATFGVRGDELHLLDKEPELMAADGVGVLGFG
jgi:hypothetical protein